MEQEKKQFVPFSTEQKKEFGAQFSPKEKQSYRKGQRNAYSHMGNIGRNNSFYIQSNLEKDYTPKPAAQAPAPKPAPATPAKQYRKPDNAPKAAALEPSEIRTVTTESGQVFMTKIYEPKGSPKNAKGA